MGGNLAQSTLQNLTDLTGFDKCRKKLKVLSSQSRPRLRVRPFIAVERCGEAA